MRSRPTSIAGRFIERDVEDVDKEEADLPLSIFLMTFFTDLGDLVEVEVLELKDMRFMLVTTFMTMRVVGDLGVLGDLEDFECTLILREDDGLPLLRFFFPLGVSNNKSWGPSFFPWGVLGLRSIPLMSMRIPLRSLGRGDSPSISVVARDERVEEEGDNDEGEGIAKC